MTLDGVMQAPGGPDEIPAGGFKYDGWSYHYWDDRMNKMMGEIMGKPFDLLLGRKTYEIFAAYWPNVKDGPDKLAADALNHTRKYVVSQHLAKADWENSTIIKGDIVKEISNLKKQEGSELQVHGSSHLLQTLLKHSLIDELHVWTYPLTLGTGKRLFGDGTLPAGLILLDCKISSTGVTIATYATGEKIKIGSFALEKPI
ncbi:MAG: dihydrofolate reductase [Promethearchaeota archaeon CR_4]|nr:MAG: dihydrofolate reductase [Candidatus Lokiarchaeota archaeon CR_4]